MLLFLFIIKTLSCNTRIFHRISFCFANVILKSFITSGMFCLIQIHGIFKNNNNNNNTENILLMKIRAYCFFPANVKMNDFYPYKMLATNFCCTTQIYLKTLSGIKPGFHASVDLTNDAVSLNDCQSKFLVEHVS